jgi:repressor LexA
MEVAAVLSAQRRQILQVIKDHTEAKGWSPSIRTIGAKVGLRSTASVQYHLRVLEEQGYLRRISAKPRIIEVNFTGKWAKTSKAPPSAASRDNLTSRNITARQRQILEVLRQGLEERGYPPSIREIGEAVGLTSSSSVHAQLEALQRKGYIYRDPTKPRTIQVRLDKPTDAAHWEGPSDGPLRSPPIYVPLMSGPIAAGYGILANDELEELWLPLPKELVGEGDLLLVRVRGDSMIEANLFDQDYVVVRRQCSAENGDIVAARLAGTDAEVTVKFFRRQHGGGIWLLPANPSFRPINGNDAEILGKVITVIRRL